MSTRFVTCGGSIAREESLGYGQRSITIAKRVPRPVRAIFERFGAVSDDPFANVATFNYIEVDWDPKARAAKLVPYWERRHI